MTSPSQAKRLDFELTDTPDPAARDAILNGLVRFNEGAYGQTRFQPLAILIRNPDTAEVMGGLWGRTSYGWLFVELLCLPEEMRREGLGSELMRAAEAEAVRRGCRGAWLETFSFQARGFYETLGYSVFGVLDDYPPGHSRFFLRKALGAAD